MNKTCRLQQGNNTNAPHGGHRGGPPVGAKHRAAVAGAGSGGGEDAAVHSDAVVPGQGQPQQDCPA